MVAAEFWIEREKGRRIDGVPQLLLALLAGVLLGVALTAFAGPVAPPKSEPALSKTWPHPALDREWRGTRTPVDVDRMFMRRR